jgi:hypothetical protein
MPTYHITQSPEAHKGNVEEYIIFSKSLKKIVNAFSETLKALRDGGASKETVNEIVRSSIVRLTTTIEGLAPRLYGELFGLLTACVVDEIQVDDRGVQGIKAQRNKFVELWPQSKVMIEDMMSPSGSRDNDSDDENEDGAAAGTAGGGRAPEERKKETDLSTMKEKMVDLTIRNIEGSFSGKVSRCLIEDLVRRYGEVAGRKLEGKPCLSDIGKLLSTKFGGSASAFEPKKKKKSTDDDDGRVVINFEKAFEITLGRRQRDGTECPSYLYKCSGPGERPLVITSFNVLKKLVRLYYSLRCLCSHALSQVTLSALKSEFKAEVRACADGQPVHAFSGKEVGDDLVAEDLNLLFNNMLQHRETVHFHGRHMINCYRAYYAYARELTWAVSFWAVTNFPILAKKGKATTQFWFYSESAPADVPKEAAADDAGCDDDSSYGNGNLFD